MDVISARILRRIDGRTGMKPDAKAIGEIFDGYSVKGAGNQKNSFEEIIGPLLGKKGKRYIKNLKAMDTILARELAKPTSGSRAAIKKWTDPGVAWWKKMFIKPLTQLGRRVTASERMAGSNAAKSLGWILQDEKLLNETIKAMEGKATRRAYYKVLTAWLIGTGRGDKLDALPFADYWNFIKPEEIGSDFKNYDSLKKKRVEEEKTSPKDYEDRIQTMQTLFDNNVMLGLN